MIGRDGPFQKTKPPRIGRALILVLGLFVFGEGPVAAQTYADAAQAYDSGNLARAGEIFRRLAEAGNTAAQVSLASLLETGELGGAPNPQAAAHWYRRAARAGDPTAQMNLGDMLAEGRGVQRDRAAAWVLLTRAAEQGRTWAERRRMHLEQEMSASSLARANDLLPDFFNESK
jgi:TPR repeat protein